MFLPSRNNALRALLYAPTVLATDDGCALGGTTDASGLLKKEHGGATPANR